MHSMGMGMGHGLGFGQRLRASGHADLAHHKQGTDVSESTQRSASACNDAVGSLKTLAFVRGPPTDDCKSDESLDVETGCLHCYTPHVVRVKRHAVVGLACCLTCLWLALETTFVYT